MAINIIIPISLQRYTGRKKYIETEPGKLGDVLRDIREDHPLLVDKLLDNKGNIKSYIKFLVFPPGNKSSPLSSKPKEFLKSNDVIKNDQVIKIILPIAGG